MVAIVVSLVVVVVAVAAVAFVQTRRRRQREAAMVSAANAAEVGCDYDAFLSYAEEDEDCASLVLEALETDAGLRCIVHTRDFEAGATIMDNIVRAVSLSRCTVLVVSKDYLKSQW